MAPRYQTPKNYAKRSDHVWVKLKEGGYKCCLCGAITNQPPNYPTPEDWLPIRIEPLTEKERGLCDWRDQVSGKAATFLEE